jgi:hypothetical protein
LGVGEGGTAHELLPGMTSQILSSIEESQLATVTGGGFVRSASGAVVGVPVGTVSGVVAGTYKAATQSNDWATFRGGFSAGYDSGNALGTKLGRAGYDAVTGAFVNVRDNWGK